MLVLLTPNPSQSQRLQSDPRWPRWFGAPIASANANTKFSRAPRDLLQAAIGSRALNTTLVFNVGYLEAIIAISPVFRSQILALYQWPDLEKLSSAKRFIYTRLIRKSAAVLSYSQLRCDYLHARFPEKCVQRIDHFVDTDFFDGRQNQDASYILCPGDHKRLEDVIAALSKDFPFKFIRFSSDPHVKAFYEEHSKPNVEFRSNISFDDVRELYRNSVAVLNAVDDQQWPVGITTFCEALSMNCKIVTSNGHSASGYVNSAGQKPYWVVDDIENIEEWRCQLRDAIAHPKDWLSGSSPRDLALSRCSFDAMSHTWTSVISATNHNHAKRSI